MSPEEKTVQNLRRDTGNALAFWCNIPRNPSAHLLFCGGYRSDMAGTKAQMLAREMPSCNIALTLFDYSGHGLSEGEFAHGTIGEWIEDAETILEHQTRRMPEKCPIILVGSSMGGWIALQIAKRQNCMPPPYALILIAPAPDFPQKLIYDRLNPRLREKLAQDGIIKWTETNPEANQDAYEQILTKKLLEESARHQLLDLLDSEQKIDWEGKLRILQGTNDDAVPWQYAQKCLHLTRSTDARFLLVEGEDHRFSSPKALQILTETISETLAER